ncbi:MAG TPA: phage head closure protein [Pseudolabrys sp.]|nr:phage head closure protein [Pseudolabrys sp.]
MDRRLVLEAPAETDDGAGGVTRSYATVTTLWAQVTPVRARSDVAADSLAALVTHRIVVRASRTLTTLNRFRDGTRIFRIVAFRETADRRFLEIDAEERED